MNLLTALLLPDLLRCAEAELSSVGHNAAAETSRKARAWRNAACALLTLVLVCMAWFTRLDEQRVVETDPPLGQRGVAGLGDAVRR